MKRLKQISLEEANEIALRNGYESYGELHQELYRHGITLEQFVRNGESFEKKERKKQERSQIKSEGMPEEVYNAITERKLKCQRTIEDIKRQKAPTKLMEQEAKREIKRYQQEIRILEKYQNEHFVIGARK